MAVQELFRANKRESTVDIVVNNIKKLLIERKLKPGDRLPNEVEISEAMNVRSRIGTGSSQNSDCIWSGGVKSRDRYLYLSEARKDIGRFSAVQLLCQ